MARFLDYGRKNRLRFLQGQSALGLYSLILASTAGMAGIGLGIRHLRYLMLVRPDDRSPGVVVLMIPLALAACASLTGVAIGLIGLSVKTPRRSAALIGVIVNAIAVAVAVGALMMR
ncbi:MAG: hypothetical protein WBD40_20475 [Tepidisphaeraceae bacterium]